jgi:hypothetical protein
VTSWGPAPPALGVKANVAATPALPATRSPAAMPNETEVTAPPITPEPAAADAVGSALVCTVTEPPALAAPNVQPVSVTVDGSSSRKCSAALDGQHNGRLARAPAVSESCAGDECNATGE